ncbi:hypothetical protein GJAV_G00150810 [Gymnothorax javanicus]|nr:hypothetical protein GJAV_G00150810 [Gymnothorax javanicus]
MTMFSTGILVLTSPLHTLPLRIAPVLSSAAQVVERTLYVHLHPGLNLSSAGQARPVYIPPAADVSSFISRLYSNAANVCGHLDVRTLSHSPDVLLTDFPLQDPGESSQVAQCLQSYTGCCYACNPGLTSVLLHPQLKCLQENGELLEKEELEGDGAAQPEPLQTYSDVVVGGTFDRLHGAHKTLLSISCLLANRRFVIGLCDTELLKRKVLKELIQPYALRADRLRVFLQDVKPSLLYEIVPISEPFGPSVTDSELQCIVVSEETKKGGAAVNKKRLENGLSELVLHEIQLMKDAHHSEIEEEKISSSSLRTRLLGTLLMPPKENPLLPDVPYVIGLSGISGSGKTSVAKRLEALGAVHINCDLIGHETYLPGAAAYRKVIEKFGEDILNEDKTVNRALLGKKVFGNEERLKSLTDILWPEMALIVKQKIRQAGEEGAEVCVVDAAVLLEAGWTGLVHEVWVIIIPEEEAVSRISTRDGLSQEDAWKRLQSQWSNARRIEHANVVLCTLWDPDITQRQVQKAWDLLQERICKSRETSNH